jgi:hypothetical protein
MAHRGQLGDRHRGHQRGGRVPELALRAVALHPAVGLPVQALAVLDLPDPLHRFWISTIYLRYHYFIDVVCGFALGWTLWRIVNLKRQEANA